MHLKAKHFAWNDCLLAMILILFVNIGWTQDYVFPTSMPSGCQGSKGTYTCNALSLGYNDTIKISGTIPAVITINGDFSTNNAKINTSGSATDLTIVINGQLQAGYQTNLNANVSATSVRDNNGTVIFGGDISTTSGSISLGYATTVAGKISSTSGNISLASELVVNDISCKCDVTVGYKTVVKGNIVAASVKDSSSNVEYRGSITTLSQSVDLGYQSRVSGAITSAARVNLATETRVDGCIQSTNSQTISLGYRARVTGVCCGSTSCTNSCVSNQTSYDAPALCASSGGGSDVNASGFNCTVVGGDAAKGRLYTQVAGTAFSIDVIALNSSGVIETNYASASKKSVTLEFVDGTGSTACSSRAALNPAVSQTVTFSSANAGRVTVSNLNVSQAYRDVRCRVTDANQSPSLVACSVDDFAVRPTSFTVTSSNANADSSGANVSASPVVKAGANFNLTAATGVVNYDGTPQIDTTKLQAHASAVNTGLVNGNFSAASASSGQAVGNAFNYNEVGYFRFAANGIYDSTFTAVDAATGDCAQGFVASGGLNACSFGNTASTHYFGRFSPDHFALSPNSVTPACSNSFTYFGQDGLTTAFVISAQNTGNTTTQNYTGSYAKLGLGTWSSFNFSAVTPPAGATLSASTTAPTGSWSNGMATVIAKHLLSRPSAVAAPTNITLYAKPLDSDGVTMTSSPVSTASPFRYGRLSMANSYGSELLPLAIPLEAQYWTGTVYQRNQQDSCSNVSVNSVAMGNYQNNLAACETALSGAGVMSAGKTTLNLSKPGAGNNGSVDLTLNLSTASGSSCTPNATNATAATLPWFGATNPTARATFGLFKSPVIYLRENF